MTNDLSHPLRPGSTAIVHQIILAKRPCLQALVKIVSPIDGEPDVYRVRCRGDRIDRIELVHAGLFQDHAEPCLSSLSRQWEWQLRRDCYSDPFRMFNIDGRQR